MIGRLLIGGNSQPVMVWVKRLAGSGHRISSEAQSPLADRDLRRQGRRASELGNPPTSAPRPLGDPANRRAAVRTCHSVRYLSTRVTWAAASRPANRVGMHLRVRDPVSRRLVAGFTARATFADRTILTRIIHACFRCQCNHGGCSGLRAYCPRHSVLAWGSVRIRVGSGRGVRNRECGMRNREVQVNPEGRVRK